MHDVTEKSTDVVCVCVGGGSQGYIHCKALCMETRLFCFSCKMSSLLMIQFLWCAIF